MYKPLSKARDGLRMNGSSTIAVAKKRKRDLMEESDSESSSTQNESTSEGDSEMNSEDGSGLSEEDDDAEQFRASQWVDEDDLDVYENRNTGAWNSGQKDLQKDLASLSFGALLKAKRTLARQEEEEEEDSSGSKSSDSGESKEERQVTWIEDEGRYEKKEKVKRANKHAPMEMSSKRPVSRKRTVVDVPSVKFRDPRFGDAVGDFSADHFRKDYGFLSDVRQQELGTLKESLKRARTLLASSPAHLRDERRLEVEKLERTMKRGESAIERSKREGFERDVMVQVKRDELAKRSQGKGAWYLKKGDEKKVKLQARFENLSGKEAKRVMEKKQKKMAQKEKKSRPFAAGRSDRGEGPRKRRRAEDGDLGGHRTFKKRD